MNEIPTPRDIPLTAYWDAMIETTPPEELDDLYNIVEGLLASHEKLERALSKAKAQARHETAMKCAEMFPETMHESTLRIYLAIRAYAESVKPVAVASTCSMKEER